MASDGVAVTGMGLVTPAGLSLGEAWDRCLRGASGIAASDRFCRSGPNGSASAAVAPFELAQILKLPKNEKFMGPGVRFAMRAAGEALATSGLRLDSLDPYRVALYTASGQTGLEGSDLFAALEVASAGDEERDYANLGGRASRLIDRFFSLRTLANAGLGLLSAELAAKGPGANFVQGDTAPALAVAAARQDLLEGRADVAIVTGYDSLLNLSTFLAYESAGLLSPSGLAHAQRPFDRASDGIALGEGAAVVVLERHEDARRREASVLGEVAAVGMAVELNDTAATEHSAEALGSAIAAAKPGERLDLVVAHGIGIVDGDRREARLVASQLGSDVPVTAFKGLTGYLGAASLLVECVLALEALRRGCAPAIARHEAPDPDCTLDLVSRHPRRLGAQTPTALCLSWSWLGQCSAVALRAPNARAGSAT